MLSSTHRILTLKSYSYCFTLAMLASSFTLAVDEVDVNVPSYFTSAGSSLTLTNGVEGDDLVSVCIIFYNRQRTKCILFRRRQSQLFLVLGNCLEKHKTADC